MVLIVIHQPIYIYIYTHYTPNTPTYNSGHIKLKTLHENMNVDPQTGGTGQSHDANSGGSGLNVDGDMNTELVISANDFNIYR